MCCALGLVPRRGIHYGIAVPTRLIWIKVVTTLETSCTILFVDYKGAGIIDYGRNAEATAPQDCTGFLSNGYLARPAT